MRNSKYEWLKASINRLEWRQETYDKPIHELYERINRLENRAKWGDEKENLRLKIIEDSLSLIARTLDANGIKEACMHCGQKLPKEKDCC